MSTGRAPTQAIRFSMALIAFSAARTEGQSAHGRSWKSEASAASRPGVSLPAIGWPPTKLTSGGSSSSAQRSTSRLVLAVSVTTAPSPNAGAISSSTLRTCRIGVATTTTAAPSAASAALRASRSIAPSLRARAATPYSVSRPPISRPSSCARLRARPSEPPISPRPMMARRGILSRPLCRVVRVLERREPRGASVAHVGADQGDDGVGAAGLSGDLPAQLPMVPAAVERLAIPSAVAGLGEAVEQAGRPGLQEHERDPVPERDAALPDIVQESGHKQVAVFVAIRAQATVHLQAVALVVRSHRFEEAALRLVQQAPPPGPQRRGDARQQRPEELPAAVDRPCRRSHVTPR